MPLNCCSMTCVTVLCTVVGRGARVSCRDRDGGRGNARILRDRQSRDGERARQHDDDRQHPGEDGAIDEEIDHDGAYSPLSWPTRPPATVFSAVGGG